jgi:enamine deaminase RidA (YjgF/YER057c/UK114 family)
MSEEQGQPSRHGVSEIMSQAVAWGGTVYLSGQVSMDGSTTVGDQTRAVLKQIDELLEEVGTDRSRLLSANIWLRDIADFDEMNSIWREWLEGVEPPARATVQAPLAGDQWLVEIMVVAAA